MASILSFRPASAGLFSRLAVLIALATGTTAAMAIGDSAGGCGAYQGIKQVVAWGTPAEVETWISNQLDWWLEHMDRKEKDALTQNPNTRQAKKDSLITWYSDDIASQKPASIQEWRDQQRKLLLLRPMPCVNEYALDYAVANGNLEVVRWLLELGVEPNALRREGEGYSSIFSRCGFLYRLRNRPDGLSPDEVRQRKIEAYRLLLDRGANIIEPNPFAGYHGCRDPEMHPVLLQLGAYVTDEALQRWYREAIRYSSTWPTVEFLAKSRPFDFRGTNFEYETLHLIALRPDAPEYEARLAGFRQLAKLVLLSPGIFPDEPATPADVPENFSVIRDRCYFPEISAYPDFELVALMRTAKPDEVRETSRDVTEVAVGATKQPVLLTLINHRKTPTQWVIRHTAEANILGVIVRGKTSDYLSFDPRRPAFLGSSWKCDVNVELVSNGDGDEKRWTLQWPKRQMSPNKQMEHIRTFSPFAMRPNVPVIASDSNQFEIGEASPSSTWITWPSDNYRWLMKDRQGHEYTRWYWHRTPRPPFTGPASQPGSVSIGVSTSP